MGRRAFLMHFVPFPGASPFLTATVLRPPSGQLPPPNTFIRLRMAVLSSGSGAVVVRCRERAGSRESMVAGACGGCNGCGRSGHGKAAYPCTQSMPQGTPACRIGTGPQRTGSLRSLLCARMAAAKKACAPFGDTGRKSRLVKRLRGKSSRIDSRDATEWRPQAVPVATQEATGIDSRDEEVPLNNKKLAGSTATQGALPAKRFPS